MTSVYELFELTSYFHTKVSLDQKLRVISIVLPQR